MIPSTDTTDTGTGTPEKALMEDAAAPAGDSDAFNTPAEVDFPDGGLRAWLVVFGAWLVIFCGFGMTSSTGAFQSYYRSMLVGYSESTVSWISSAQAFFSFFPGVFTGSLFDKYGHRPLVCGGTILVALGFVLLSFSKEYYQIFLCHATLIAWGCNLLFVSPLGVVGQWFMRRRGLAFGITSSGASIGAVVWPLVIANLPQKVGFGWTCRVLALIVLVFGTTAIFFLKTRLLPKPKGMFFYWAAFRDPRYALVAVTFFTWGFAYFSFQLYIGTYGSVVGLGSFAPYLLIINNGCSTFGRLLAGYLADKIGGYNSMISGTAVLAIMLWCWLAIKSLGGCIALVIIAGIASGSFLGLQAPVAMYTAKDQRLGGTMFGQAVCFQSFGILACGPAVGAVLGVATETTFMHAKIFIAVFMTAAIAALVAGRLVAQPKLLGKV